MNPHFFTAPFYFAFIWFRVHGSRFRALVAASPPFLEDDILVSQPSTQSPLVLAGAFPTWGVFVRSG